MDRSAAMQELHRTGSQAGISSPAAQQDDEWRHVFEPLVRDRGLASLEAANVLTIGLGCVGGFSVLKNLCRAGIGAMTIVHGDQVDPTKRYRRQLALSIS